MSIIEIQKDEQTLILQIVASILHMGNVGFSEEEGRAVVLKPESVTAIAKVIEIHLKEKQIEKSYSS